MVSTMSNLLCLLLFMGAVIVAANITGPQAAGAATAAEIDRDVDIALEKLYASTPAAKELSTVAKGILVFPVITKGGFVETQEDVLKIRRDTLC